MTPFNVTNVYKGIFLSSLLFFVFFLLHMQIARANILTCLLRFNFIYFRLGVRVCVHKIYKQISLKMGKNTHRYISIIWSITTFPSYLYEHTCVFTLETRVPRNTVFKLHDVCKRRTPAWFLLYAIIINEWIFENSACGCSCKVMFDVQCFQGERKKDEYEWGIKEESKW